MLFRSALLAGGTDAGSVDRNLVLRAFLQLPRPLKQQLGPTLADQFLAANDLDSAGMILDAAAGREMFWPIPDSAVWSKTSATLWTRPGWTRDPNLAARRGAAPTDAAKPSCANLETSLAGQGLLRRLN